MIALIYILAAAGHDAGVFLGRVAMIIGFQGRALDRAPAGR